MSVLVTFDIDGTLICCEGNGKIHHAALREALKTMFGYDEEVQKFNGQFTGGATDYFNAYEAIKKSKDGVDPTPQELTKFQAISEEYFIKNFDHRLRILPGVELLLNELYSNENVVLGIVSGNYPKVAHLKLQSAKLNKYFTQNVEGLGDLSANRSELLKAAIEKGEKLINGHFDRIIHIGDSPKDIQAAIDCHAIGVLTLTSWHDYDKSAFPSPRVTFENLEICHDQCIQLILGENRN